MHNCILIIDDSYSVRKMLEREIGRQVPNSSISTACDGKEAIHRMSQHTFSIIISDLEMPNMDGNEFAEKLKKNPLLRRKKIILFTSKPEAVSKIVKDQEGIYVVDKGDRQCLSKIVELVKTLI